MTLFFEPTSFGWYYAGPGTSDIGTQTDFEMSEWMIADLLLDIVFGLYSAGPGVAAGFGSLAFLDIVYFAAEPIEVGAL